MLYEVSTFLCLLLMAIGVFFILLERKAGIDRNLPVFAVRNLLIGLFCAVDLWVMRGERSSMGWILVQHVLCAFLPALFVWNIMIISGRLSRAVIGALFAVALAFSALFLFGVMLRVDGGGAIAATALYSWLFEPYLIATLTYLLYLHLANLLHCATPLLKAMRAIQLCGLALFYAFAVISLSYSTVAASFFRMVGFDISEYTILGALGVLGYCVIGTVTIVNKFTALMAAQKEVLKSLREAVSDLETTKPLREIGQASAFVNHEIKNYMMVISGYTALLARSKEINERDRGMVDNIAAAVAKLQEFSLSVLELSKSKVTHENKEIELAGSLRSCIGVYFHKQAAKISLSCSAPQGELLLNGSPEKLSRVFINALRNAFEAGAHGVAVRLSVYGGVALIVIEDDGVGCDAEHLPSFFTTFFTTKQDAGGTGLGLCIIRSIVEAHNGSVSIYSKNLLGAGNHGLEMQITIPASKQMQSAAPKFEVMLLKGGLNDTTGIINILKNLQIIPHIADKPKGADLTTRNSALGLVVLVAAQKASEVRGMVGDGGGAAVKVLAIEEGEAGVLFACGDDGNKKLFTEEFIAGYLCGD